MLVRKKQIRRKTERLYAKENSVSVERAVLVLRHDKKLFEEYREKVEHD